MPWRRLAGLVSAAAGLRASMGACEGYPAVLRDLHEANARELELLVDEEGWPTPEMAGEDGCAAALAIAVDALSRPGLMRRCLGQLKTASARGEAPPEAPARLERRIRALDGRGTDDDLPFPAADLDRIARDLGWRK